MKFNFIYNIIFCFKVNFASLGWTRPNQIISVRFNPKKNEILIFGLFGSVWFCTEPTERLTLVVKFLSGTSKIDTLQI